MTLSHVFVGSSPTVEVHTLNLFLASLYAVEEVICNLALLGCCQNSSTIVPNGKHYILSSMSQYIFLNCLNLDI